MGVVPFDKDNKLSAKRVFNKTALKEIQAELPEYLKERGFDIERGEKDSERKNLSVPEYKKAMAEVELIENETETLYQTKNALEDEIEPLREEVNKLSEKRDGLAKELSATYVEDPKKIYRSNQSKDHVLVHRQDIARYQKQNELVPKLVKQNENLQAENKELDDENISLLEENQIQEAQIFQMQEMLEMARERMERFVEKGAKLWDRVVTYSSKFYPKAKEITPSEMQNNDDGERDYQEWRLRARRHEMER
jgi:cell division protein FtsB